MPYLVRDAYVEEVFRMTEISRDVLQETEVYRDLAFDMEKSANYIYGAIAKQPGWFCKVIAERFSDKVVGGLVAACEVTLFGPDKIAYDVTMMIDKEHRGRCIPELVRIVDLYREWALEQGAKVVKIGISSGMNIDKASQFLERMDFKRIGAMHGYVLGV